MVEQLLLTSTESPLYSVGEIAVKRALIVAPHPDDETLGCGGAIALLRSIGCDVSVLVVSDGTLSHPNSKKYPPLALRELRESETIAALAILGVEAKAITFLRLPDGAVANNNPDLSSYLTQVAPEIVFLPLRYDPHPDHRASFELVSNALTSLNMSARQIAQKIEVSKQTFSSLFLAVHLKLFEKGELSTLNCIAQSLSLTLVQLLLI